MDQDAPFPPRDWKDIWAYPDDDVVAGYREYRRGEPDPGPNRAPGYRWGWCNAKRDISREEDGFSSLRIDYIQKTMAIERISRPVSH